mgnify:CR=1 FL=1
MNKLKRKPLFDLGKKIRSLKDVTVKIGFPKESSETQSEAEGVSPVFKATVNNFGLGVPKRPFINIAFAKNKRDYKIL